MIKLDVLDKEIYIRMKGIRLGAPTVREANGAEHPLRLWNADLGKLTYFSPIYMDFRIYRDDLPPSSTDSDIGFIEEEGVHIETSQLWSDQEGVTYIQITSREPRRSR